MTIKEGQKDRKGKGSDRHDVLTNVTKLLMVQIEGRIVEKMLSHESAQIRDKAETDSASFGRKGPVNSCRILTRWDHDRDQDSTPNPKPLGWCQG